MQFALNLSFLLQLRENITLLVWKHIVSFIIHHESSCWENSMSSSNQIDSRARGFCYLQLEYKFKKKTYWIKFWFEKDLTKITISWLSTSTLKMNGKYFTCFLLCLGEQFYSEYRPPWSIMKFPKKHVKEDFVMW